MYLKLHTLKVLISSIALSMLLSSCTSIEVVPETKYIYTYPEKIPAPVAPKLSKLDATKSLEHPTNFKALQVNFSLLKNYIEAMKTTITYYENSIDELKSKRDSQ